MDFKELCQSLTGKASSFADNLLDRIPGEKRRFFLLLLGGLVFLAICLTVIALAAGGRARDPGKTASGQGIPAEELFYPREPDFLPSLLLEREPRQPWTREDLELFWQDPKAYNEDRWRDAAKAAVDKLMEEVP